MPSYIQYMDVIQSLEKQGVQMKISDISDRLNLPQPGVTRTVKEMEKKGLLEKPASPEDGRVTYISMTVKGKELSQKYDEHYFSGLAPYLDGISETDADCTQGSILKKLIAFMFPVLGALILQAAYGAVDLLVVGRFGSTSGLSAVSTGSQVLNLVTFVVVQFAMGITVLIARYLGEKRPEQIGAVIGGAAVIFTVISAVLFIIMVGFAHPIAVLMQAPEEAVSLTTMYVRICGGGIFFIVAYNLLSAIFRGLGDSQSPLLFGLEASSGYGVACKIVNFAMLVPSALMQSMASFVSQNIGAGEKKRAKRSMFTGIGVGLVVGCMVFALVMLKGDVLSGFFSTEETVIQKGYAYLKGFARKQS